MSDRRTSRRPFRSWYAVALVAVIGMPSVARAQAPSAPAATASADSPWWRHVTRLAHDSMRGREAGSPEHRKAAEYVAGEFARAGLQPAGAAGHGFLQPVGLLERRVDESASRLAIVRDGREETIGIGVDAIVSARFAPTVRVDAPIV